MRRKLFNFVAAMSLVTCLSTAALWVRGYRHADQVRFTTNHANPAVDPAMVSLSGRDAIVGWTRGELFIYVTNEVGDVWREYYDRELKSLPEYAEGPKAAFSTDLPADVGDMFSYTPQSKWEWGGFCFGFRVGTPPSLTPNASQKREQWHVAMPVWPVLLVSAILPAIWLTRRVRQKPDNHCAVCGYNLTGNTSGVCPECGKAVHVLHDPDKMGA